MRIDPANCELGRDDIEALVRRSWELVFDKLPKEIRKALRSA